MAADFFERQDHARRSTLRLIVLFALAVVAIMVSIEVLLAATMGFVTRDPRTGEVDWTAVADPTLLFVAVAGTLIVVGGGTLYKMAALRAGGHVVAEQLGGRLLSAGSGDPIEQRLLNVVEEMAIASGTSTPPVYLLDQEEGINAFAAGFSPADAVIGITRGTATRLSRDELQGVVAHEFSHILNGDMRLNIRLMGLLHGILIIGMLGYFILRMSFYSRMGRRSRGRDNGMPILALGAGLAVIGFAGTFFGNLIKAAVSRQREFLADASAVQFTRQADGLAGALKKIGGFAAGSSIANPNAPEASHMFFGRATSGFSAMFSTHPPLAERIRRIDPAWDGTFDEAAPVRVVAPSDVQSAGAMGFAGGQSQAPARAEAVAGAVASIGQPSPAHLDYARRLLARLPADLVMAARDPYGARAVVHALLLDSNPSVRDRQLARLKAHADRGVTDETRRLAPQVAALPARMRLPLLEITLPALRALSERQYSVFEQNVIALAEADDKIDVFEWSLHRILVRELAAQRAGGQTARIRYRSVEAVRTPAEILLSTLAYAGQRNTDGIRSAFERGRASLGLSGSRLLAADACRLDALDEALAALDEAAPAVKRQLIDAAVACITADNHVTVTEAELLRAVAASMSCPMPPILMD